MLQGNVQIPCYDLQRVQARIAVTGFNILQSRAGDAYKRKLQDLIHLGMLNTDDDIHLFINIDEQPTATNGYYDLRDSIVEELQHGIISFNYGITHEKVFNGQVKVDIQYCESKHNFLIQASDILANRIWSSYQNGKPERRRLSNHTALTFP